MDNNENKNVFMIQDSSESRKKLTHRKSIDTGNMGLVVVLKLCLPFMGAFHVYGRVFLIKLSWSWYAYRFGYQTASSKDR